MYNYNIDWFSVTISSKAIFLFLSDCIFRTGFYWNNWSSRIYGRQRKGGVSDHYYLRNSLIYVTATFNLFNFLVSVSIKPWGCSKSYYPHWFCFTLSHVLYALKFTLAMFQQRPNFLSETFFPKMRRQKPVGDSHKKGQCALRKFWKEPLRGTKILFCGRGLKFFHHKRSQEVPILKQHIILFHIFTAQYLKRTLKLPLWTV